jgi:hypothetical protein
MAEIKYFGNAGLGSVKATSTAQYGLKPGQQFNNSPQNKIKEISTSKSIPQEIIQPTISQSQVKDTSTYKLASPEEILNQTINPNSKIDLIQSKQSSISGGTNQSSTLPAILTQPKLETPIDYNTFLKSQQPIYNLPNVNLKDVTPSPTIKNIQPSLPIYQPEREKPISSVEQYQKVNQYQLPILQKIPNIINLQEQKDISNQNYGKLLLSGSLAFSYGFVKSLIDIPVSTIKSIIEFPSDPGGVIERSTVGAYQGIKKGFEEEPFQTAGSLTAMALFPKIVEKTPVIISDYARTFNLEKLPKEKIIAQEYPIQKYPQISKGETAGELLNEFKPKLPGEIKPAGFTSSPKPIKADKGVLSGSSELPGLYQSPEVSPEFLRLAGEKKNFGLNPFETLRPTISRVTPIEFELPKGVKFSSDVNPSNLANLKEFFYNEAEKGKSYVTFIKSEKESIIPFDTQLEYTGKRFFIEFENRKIPIEEFKTLSEEIIKNNDNIFSAKDISESYRIGKSSTYTPLDLFRIYSSDYSSSNSELSYSYNIKSNNVYPNISKDVSSTNYKLESYPDVTSYKNQNYSSKTYPSKTYSEINQSKNYPSEVYKEINNYPNYKSQISIPKIQPISQTPTINLNKEQLKKEPQQNNKNSYFVFIKQATSNKPNIPIKKEYIKVNNQPLNLNDARDELVFELENSVSRSGFIKPTNLKPKNLQLDIPNTEYEENIYKYRPYKIHLGKKIAINGIIKKSHYLLDTQGAKEHLKYFKELDVMIP